MQVPLQALAAIKKAVGEAREASTNDH